MDGKAGEPRSVPKAEIFSLGRIVACPSRSVDAYGVMRWDEQAPSRVTSGPGEEERPAREIKKGAFRRRFHRLCHLVMLPPGRSTLSVVLVS